MQKIVIKNRNIICSNRYIDTNTFVLKIGYIGYIGYCTLSMNEWKNYSICCKNRFYFGRNDEMKRFFASPSRKYLRLFAGFT